MTVCSERPSKVLAPMEKILNYAHYSCCGDDPNDLSCKSQQGRFLGSNTTNNPVHLMLHEVIPSILPPNE